MNTVQKHNSSRCRCIVCRSYRSRQTVSARHERAAGRPRLLDAEPVRARIRYLGYLGMSPPIVAEAAGLSPTVLTRILFPNKGRRTERVHRNTADAVFAVKFDLDFVPDRAKVLAIGTKRRVQALVALGWSMARLAQMMGMDGTHPDLLKHDRVTAKKARAVRALYDRLWDQKPPAENRFQLSSVRKTIRWAEREGFHPPQVWDDDTIDDPDAVPEIGVDRPRGAEKAPVDEVLFLASYGQTVEAIARRFGVTEALIKQKLKEAA